MTIFVAVQKRGTIALPPELRARFGLDQPGVQLEIVERDGEIVLRPHLPVPTEEAWFWTADWQTREHAVDAHVHAGETTTFADAEALLVHLDTL